MARDGSNEGEDKKLGVAEALGPGPACLPWMRKQGKERWEGVSGACHAFRMAVRISGNMTVNPKSSRRRAMFCKDSIFGPVNDCGPMKLSAKGRFLRWCWVTGWHSRPEVGVEKKRLRPFRLGGDRRFERNQPRLGTKERNVEGPIDAVRETSPDRSVRWGLWRPA